MITSAEKEYTVNWNEYVEQIHTSDPDAFALLDEAKEEAAIITAIIQQRNAHGLSQRDLASLCSIPQSSVARIESYKTNPKLITILKILRQLGLKITISPATQPAQ